MLSVRVEHLTRAGVVIRKQYGALGGDGIRKEDCDALETGLCSLSLFLHLLLPFFPSSQRPLLIFPTISHQVSAHYRRAAVDRPEANHERFKLRPSHPREVHRLRNRLRRDCLAQTFTPVYSAVFWPTSVCVGGRVVSGRP